METNTPFINHPLLDFSLEKNRLAVEQGLLEVDALIGAKALKAVAIIDGKPVSGTESYIRHDPSNVKIVIGSTQFATIEHATLAMESCRKGFPAWRARPSKERAEILRKLAILMKDQAALLTAIIIREAGKPWKEADGDLAEAIDFCNYYAAEMLRIAPTRRTEEVLGEDNVYLYQPRGVAVVISPWNFPLAITCGMAVAALVTGNTVVLKPSAQGSLIAHEFAKLVLAAGVPRDAFAFLPGHGAEIGRFLVNHPDTALIAFTGSRAVGLEILRSAAAIAPGQHGIKRVIAELGGKNAIIVDEDADFDDAVRGVLSSAFGFAGQKCSACSRLIVVGEAYETFLARLAAALEDLIVGRAENPASFLGPVIDDESHARISTMIQSAQDLTVLAVGRVPTELVTTGSFIAPTIFRDVPTTHPIWKDEIFGPVLACTKADNFDHALSLAVESDYALTGGVFSRHPDHIAKARTDFRVGNLYINRSITGAMVGRQPFGGFKFSGVGSKAGGPDYLLQFLEPRVITENTMRRGFTPDLNN